MKKILFATTALIATAGIATADVTLSGSAEMGIFGGDDTDLQFHTDIDVTFTMTGETDGGLQFGASIDLDESDGTTVGEGETSVDPGPDGVLGTDDDFVVVPAITGGSDAFIANRQGGETIFISGAFGTLTMGDTDGALDFVMQETDFGGSIADDHTAHNGFNGNVGLDGQVDGGDGQIARYEYSFGAFTAAMSLEQIDDGADDDVVLGLGARYEGDFAGYTIGFGLGYQTIGDIDFDGDGTIDDGVDVIGVSLDGSFLGADVALNYTDFDGFMGMDDHMAIGAGFEFAGASIGANYGVYDMTDGSDKDGYGLAVGYDLGGGAEVQFGYGHDDDDDTYSFGVAMSF